MHPTAVFRNSSLSAIRALPSEGPIGWSTVLGRLSGWAGASVDQGWGIPLPPRFADPDTGWRVSACGPLSQKEGTRQRLAPHSDQGKVRPAGRTATHPPTFPKRHKQPKLPPPKRDEVHPQPDGHPRPRPYPVPPKLSNAMRARGVSKAQGTPPPVPPTSIG